MENRRPLLRSTASGLTAHVDPRGRLQAVLPAYTEGWLVADVPLPPGSTTFYTRHGDWFPQAGGSLLLALLCSASPAGRRAFPPGRPRRFRGGHPGPAGGGARRGGRPGAPGGGSPRASDPARPAPGRRSGQPASARIEIAGDPGRSPAWRDAGRRSVPGRSSSTRISTTAGREPRVPTRGSLDMKNFL